MVFPADLARQIRLLVNVPRSAYNSSRPIVSPRCLPSPVHALELGVAAPRVRPYTYMAARQVWEGALEATDESMPREIANEAFLQAEYELSLIHISEPTRRS